MADVTATVKTKKDGIVYQVGDTIPDMGTLVCVSREGNRLFYEGMSADENKLPTTGLETGSQVLFYDTAIVKKFEAKSGEWKILGGE